MKTTLGWAVTLAALATGLAAAPTGAQQPGVAEFHRMGEGPRTLLLIPCMSCRWRSWEPFMDRNRDRFQMIAVTLAGFGGVPVPDIPMNGRTPAWREAALDGLGKLIDSEIDGAVTVVGHSFGGEIAVALAASRPDRIERLVLVDSWPFSDRSWFREALDKRVEQANETATTQMDNLRDADEWQAFNSPPSYASHDRQLAYHGWFMATPREVMLQYWRENSIQDLNPMLGSLEIPVLDLKAISPSVEDADSAQVDRARSWERNGRPGELHPVFLLDSYHFVMEHRPEALDEILRRFVYDEVLCREPGEGWVCPQ